MREDRYDDWKLSSGQVEKVFTHCTECGEDIYIGEHYIKLDNGDVLHTEGECFERYVNSYFSPKYRVAGDE